MIRLLRSTAIRIASFLLVLSTLSAQKTSKPFEFQFEGKTLRGLIEQPAAQKSQAIVLLIPGYGPTDFVKGNWYATLRDSLVATGLTVCLWDKMGCGKSEGAFNAQQPVASSAAEAIAAITKIKSLQIEGADKIGLWGLSRAGWICPLINEQYPIDFWISVSGTDDKENFGYLLKSNLLIAGKSEQEAEVLFQSWKQGHRISCTQGSYAAFINAIQPLMQDSICRSLFGYPQEAPITEEAINAFKAEQALYTSKGYFDAASGLWVYIPDFEEKLNKIDCPVLALFGAKDSQVDWRKTKALYEKTIGSKPTGALTTKVFQVCNHNLQKCVTCGYQEDLAVFNWQACDAYYTTMHQWLIQQEIVEP